MDLEKIQDAYDWIMDQIGWFCLLLGSTLTVILGQWDLEEPWKHVLVLIGLAASNISALMIKRPRSRNSKTRAGESGDR